MEKKPRHTVPCFPILQPYNRGQIAEFVVFRIVIVLAALGIVYSLKWGKGWFWKCPNLRLTFQ